MKKTYIQPRVKTVSFHVELGYGASVTNLVDGAMISFRDDDNNSTNRNGRYGAYSASADGSYNFFGE